MKKFSAFVLMMLLGFVLITFINQEVNVFGENNQTPVAEAFINKSVNNANSEVIFNETEDAETGSANIVTSVIANYRSFDTLGEVTVLFISSLGVALLLASNDKKRLKLNYEPNFMQRVGSKALFGIIILVGVSMAMHGHLTPGGGFPGGAMIAAAMLLLYISNDEFRVKMNSFKLLEGLMGSLYVIIGLVGLFSANYFLVNVFDTGIVGQLLSGGIVPIIYVIVGLKVGSELTSVIDDFMSEEVN